MSTTQTDRTRPADVRRRRRTRVLCVLVGVAVLTAPASAGAADPVVEDGRVSPASTRDPLAVLETVGDVVRLSDETTVTRWAHPMAAHRIRSAPRDDAKTVGRLRKYTEDARPEVYLVLSAELGENGDPWLRIRIPTRAAATTGWVPADRLDGLRVVRTQLTIERSAKKATLRSAGRVVWTSRVGIGRSSSPTPVGAFYVRELLRGGGGAYGPWAFGTSAYSKLSDWPGGGVVGIHGTNQPGLIPGAPSHGCVRVPNAAISKLAKLMPIGTPVSVRP